MQIAVHDYNGNCKVSLCCECFKAGDRYLFHFCSYSDVVCAKYQTKLKQDDLFKLRIRNQSWFLHFKCYDKKSNIASQPEI